MSDDLISRQAAIGYAISGLTREIDGEKWIRVSEVRESIKELPSEQPTVDVVRCKDCKHHDEGKSGAIYCPILVGGFVREDFFCADGERRE